VGSVCTAVRDDYRPCRTFSIAAGFSVSQAVGTTNASDQPVREKEIEMKKDETENSVESHCYPSWQCSQCGYFLVGGTCDNGCPPGPASEFDRLRTQVKAFLRWFNSDGSPCDGPRFREEQAKLRAMID
jgi:hypothetical protein